MVLAFVAACKPSLLSVTCECPNLQSWMATYKKKHNEINLSGQAEPSSPYRHRTDNIVLMKPFYLEAQGQGNRITSLIPISFAKLSHFSLFPFGILLSQAKISRATDIPSSHCLYQCQPDRVWKNDSITRQDAAGSAFSALCDVDGSTSKCCPSIQSLDNG